ncbi:ATP synthase subunit ATP5MPL, mitochondrial-like [Ursus maritimus]|uniref:ATP synthase subunit ATP5MPL, mitochondrial-like n=1 Tax=Ursus maritimus TaxID=29073 RepID=A0A8M1GA56_URSMA|nr:ATP synthase subunit ATP5MPL, mitochondrial-like [Ursus maritimus]
MSGGSYAKMFQSLVKNARVPTKPYSTQVYQESWVAMGLIGFITYEIKQVKALKA